MSSTAFYVYSIYLKELIHIEAERKTEFERSIQAALNLLKDQFYYSIDTHDGGVIKTILQRLNEHDEVLDAYLYNGYGDIKFTLKNDTAQYLKVSMEELLNSEEEITLKSFPEEEQPFTRAFFRMTNAPSCYECHDAEQENLGFVVIDMAMNNTGENLNFIRKSSILFTLIMILVISAFIMLMHYRFVRKSLVDFRSTIHSINNGNLDTRLSIPETKELGLLGQNFNNMVDNFQRAQNELKEFHRKEMRSNYKLATIGEMSARLAHEIRNPITGIANAIEIIVNETDDQEKVSIFEETQRQTARVNNAITDLLKYARKRDLNLERNNINELIPQLVFFLENQVKDKKINFKLELQEDLPIVRFDHMQMEDVLLNLGINAIQAIAESGSISYNTSFSSTDKRIIICVTDTGKGIPEDNLSDVFWQ